MEPKYGLRYWIETLTLAVIVFGSLFAIKNANAVGTSATVTLTAPTTYTDGVALPASEVDHYTIKWTTPGGSPQSRAITTLSTTVIIPCGTATFTASVTTTATAHTASSESADTNPLVYNTGIACRPNPPAMIVE